ncbi:XK [Branchiostoma lanceolatum]|uniref:XK-related protein n=1 Tax=Branchiostoma lanceolatum TaxID=7740 RepID=A0A8K0A3E2_BRALA|nr:XK [Branchiostoma lanceolatum]
MYLHQQKTKMCHCVQSCWLVIRTLAGFALYIADFVTDVILAAEYYRNGDYYWFGLTLGFALVPQVIVNIMLAYLDGCKWYYLLPLGVPAKYFQVLYTFIYDEHQPRYTMVARQTKGQENQAPVARAVNHLLPLARLVGTLLESLPEICLQIYVLLRTGELDSLEIQPLKVVTMTVSFLASLYSIIEWETHFPNVTCQDKQMATMCLWVLSGWLVFRTLLGFALYIADFVTDVILAVEYAINNHYYWFGLTLGFALGPQLIINIVLAYLDHGCKWYYLLGVPAKYFQVLYAFFRGKDNPEDVLEAREKDDHEDQKPVARAVNHLLPLARLVGTLLESLPEICLQIYVLILTGGLSSLEIPPLKAVTMALSFLASLYSIIEWETHFPKVVAWVWGPLVFVWKVIDLPARILALCLFASIYKYWVFVVVGLHWLVMAVVENMFCRYLCDGNAWVESGADVISKSNCCVKFMFNAFVVAPVDVFTWVTFGSRLRCEVQPIVNSLLMLVTNIVMVSVWYSMKGNGSWYDEPALGVVIGGSIASFLLQGLYWLCYSPRCRCSPLEDVYV